jgi:hypothetical protein
MISYHFYYDIMLITSKYAHHISFIRYPNHISSAPWTRGKRHQVQEKKKHVSQSKALPSRAANPLCLLPPYLNSLQARGCFDLTPNRSGGSWHRAGAGPGVPQDSLSPTAAETVTQDVFGLAEIGDSETGACHAAGRSRHGPLGRPSQPEYAGGRTSAFMSRPKQSLPGSSPGRPERRGNLNVL